MSLKKRCPVWRARHILASIDRCLQAQLKVILHHPTFQQLEASWRGLDYLVKQKPENAMIKIKVLNVSWDTLARDLSRAADFDQSQLFMKVYHNEFGHPGGEPYGLLIGDYYISHRCKRLPYLNDLQILASIAKIAAVAFCPFITAVHPSLLGLDDLAELERAQNLPRIFSQTQYQSWKKLRTDDDARFIGLVLPRVLMRLPYANFFKEDVCKKQHYLWGNACYAFAAVVMRSFNDSGWFTGICGTEMLANGVVPGLERHYFATDKANTIYKYATEVCISEKQEAHLCEAGFIALAACKYTSACAFYSDVSIHTTQRYSKQVANNNAYLSGMLHYLLCVSRFAHFIKMIARDKIGTFATASTCEAYLHTWLRQYTASTQALSPALKAKYPLREAQIKIRELAGKPGSFLCIIHVNPHLQLDQLEFNLKLMMEIARQ